MCMPIVDWNGNGRIDPEEIALGLAIAQEEEEDDGDDEDDEDDEDEEEPS